MKEANRINPAIAAITGTPLNLSKGETTRKVPVSGPSADLGAGPFNPRAGANPNGNYMVKGCEAYGSGANMKKKGERPFLGRSQSAGMSR
jgi:hypothetical protein